MKASEFLKQHEQKKKREQEDENSEPDRDHSLQENARERADHPDHINAGTPYDYEDIDAYQKELDRLDREGPGYRSNEQKQHNEEAEKRGQD